MAAILGQEAELNFQRTNLALGRPVDVEAALDLANDLLCERDESTERLADLEELIGDVLRAFDRFEAANAKKSREAGLEALCDLVDQLRCAAQAIGHVALTVEDSDDA
jgi:hypothetical protein